MHFKQEWMDTAQLQMYGQHSIKTTQTIFIMWKNVHSVNRYREINRKWSATVLPWATVIIQKYLISESKPESHCNKSGRTNT